jgi:DNA-binding IclR family transcriptional regulator
MSDIRKAGFAVTTGQLNKHLTAIAAPIIPTGERQAIGSLTLLAKDFRKGEPALMAAGI